PGIAGPTARSKLRRARSKRWRKGRGQDEERRKGDGGRRRARARRRRVRKRQQRRWGRRERGAERGQLDRTDRGRTRPDRVAGLHREGLGEALRAADRLQSDGEVREHV